MTEEDKIWREGLKALRDENPEPSPDVKKWLLREFRAHRQPVRRWVWWGIPAAAAITAVVIAVMWFSTRPASVHNRVLSLRQEPVQKPVQAPAVIAVNKPVSVQRPQRKRVRRPPPPKPQEPLEFIALPYGKIAGPLERGTVVRVSLPGSAMAEVGLPVNPDRMFEPVQADVVLGEDGIARAIRFVSYP